MVFSKTFSINLTLLHWSQTPVAFDGSRAAPRLTAPAGTAEIPFSQPGSPPTELAVLRALKATSSPLSSSTRASRCRYSGKRGGWDPAVPACFPHLVPLCKEWKRQTCPRSSDIYCKVAVLFQTLPILGAALPSLGGTRTFRILSPFMAAALQTGSKQKLSFAYLWELASTIPPP